MDNLGKDRQKVWTPLFFSLVLVFGMALGFNLRDTLRSKRDLVTVIQRNDRLDEIIDLVHEKYVDTVNPNNLYKDAVTGILKSLDPHTVYIPADEVQSVNDDLEGSFTGIGVEFNIVRDTIEVTSIIDKGPAANAGMEVGDQLVRVGDSLVAGVHITPEHISRQLKGKPQSKVTVTIRSVSGGGYRALTITRGTISVSSIEASLMLDAHTGYIKISRFSASTADEFKKALQKLVSAGATQLIADLRENPGGYLDAATSIADNFLDDNKMIVYTKGTHVANSEYRAHDQGLFEKGRLVVLVDESSASASEILAGAIQDWDRGVIIGRRTFGKGLVQEQYDLSDGSALRLTIARYYTPSGRCIQRSFADGKEAYLEAYENRFTNGDLTGRDTAFKGDTTPYYTAAHRLVYGGGGINPDVYVPYDTTLYSAALRNMLYSEELKTAVWDYFIHNRSRLKTSSLAEYAASFDGQEQVADNYLAMLEPGTRRQAKKELAEPGPNSYFNVEIKAMLARYLFKDNGYYSISVTEDPVVTKAVAIINSPEYLKIVSGK